MALRTLAARVRTSSAAVRLQTPAVGRPNLHSAARRLSPPAGGPPRLTPSRNLGSSPREDAARKMVLETAATLEHLEKTYETFKARVGLLEKAATFLKWSWACIIPVPLVYAIAQHY
ncbi:uncharacterized protein LOC119288294 [Triticum dicoccoides]|uniref:uncharacterized protein LOC119288294 n=1 Tax=Triticum dicoccoides TaxID=85692 RepID=UPI00189015F7|nr:uncharacterized protein LOC119288294 [Triticum dicoccoides]